MFCNFAEHKIYKTKVMKTKLFWRVLALLLVMFCSCKTKSVEKESVVSQDSVIVEEEYEEWEDTVETEAVECPIKLTSAEKKIAEGLNGGFAMNLFKKYYMSTGDKKNSLLSPLSASYALSMLANGANGDTQKEILSVLGIGTSDLNVLNNLNKKLATTLPLNRFSTAKTANGLWLDKGFEPRKPFVELLQSYYDAEISAVDLQTDGREIINQWCAEKTRGKIRDIINEIPEKTDFVLANALYFKGFWRDYFSEAMTKEYTFNNQDGTGSEVEFMQKTSREKYFKNFVYSSVTLPFGGPYSMVFILPNEGVSLDECVNTLGDEPLTTLSGTEKRNLDMKIPKFSMYDEIGLNGYLEVLGMKKAFLPEADFSNIIDNYTTLNHIITQKAFLKIDEKGGEAAVMTMNTVIGSASIDVHDKEIIDFRLDRPFAYILFETDTNTILFMGAIKHMK